MQTMPDSIIRTAVDSKSCKKCQLLKVKFWIQMLEPNRVRRDKLPKLKFLILLIKGIKVVQMRRLIKMKSRDFCRVGELILVGHLVDAARLIPNQLLMIWRNRNDSNYGTLNDAADSNNGNTSYFNINFLQFFQFE